MVTGMWNVEDKLNVYMCIEGFFDVVFYNVL